MSNTKKLDILNNLYKELPRTNCKASCGDWCCTKLKILHDEQGNFLSLPLVYSIEFKNILNYLQTHFNQEEINKLTSINNKKATCTFRDKENNRCLIYEVEPFSCRVYGHRVPSIFWGIKYPAALADNIYCKDMKVTNYAQEAAFLNKYQTYWDTLAALSSDFSLFDDNKRKIIKEVIGVSDIKILGWLEFNLLVSSSLDWFENNFATFWKTYGALL